MRSITLLLMVVGLLGFDWAKEVPANDVREVIKKLSTLEQELDSVVCSGHLKFGKKVDFDFFMRNRLMKEVETKDSETVVGLWNRDGFFVLRRPKGGEWSLAGQQPIGQTPTKSIKPIAMEAASIFGRSLLKILEDTEYSVESVAADSSDAEIVVLKLKYLPGMSSFDWKDKSKRDKMPVFDEATIRLDSSSRYRIVDYQVKVSFEGQKGLNKVKLLYDKKGKDSVHVPSTVEVDFCNLNGTRTRQDLSSCSRLSPDAPPESEFTLEHYGLKTPKPKATVNWWFVGLFALLSVTFLFIGIRFFRR